VKWHRFALVPVGLFLALLCGCDSHPGGSSKKTTGADHYGAREECKTPNMNCYKGCFQRGEERYCPACCFDNLILCDEGNAYDFEACATAETNPTPRPLPRPKGAP